MRSITPNLNVFTNPIAVRSARARLRWKHILSWGVIVLSVTSFICTIVYETQIQRELGTREQAAESLLLPLIIIQAVLLMFLGTGAVASGLARERENRLLDYQRMTPMSPVAKIVGYLFGLPVREYFLFALTLPFVAFAVIVSGFEVSRLIEFYAVFFSSVWLYHMTGMVAGMATSRPRLATAMSQGLVLVLYFVLPRLGLVGFRFFEHLTMLPTFSRLVFEETAGRWRGDPSFDPARFSDVPFFDWDVAPSAFTLIVQAFILIFMFAVVYRKWKDERYHPLSKSLALFMFAGTTVFLVGSVWPLIRREGAVVEFVQAWDPGGRVDPDAFAPAMILQFVMFAFAMISGAVCLAVIGMITPSRHATVSGFRLARKVGRVRPPWNSDAASSLPVVVAMIVLTTVAQVLLIRLTYESGRFITALPPVGTWIPPILLNAGVFLFVHALRERFSMRAFFVGSFLLWMVPFFVSTTLLAAWSFWTTGSYVGLPFPPLSYALATFRFFHEAEVVNPEAMWEGPTPILQDIPAMTWTAAGLYLTLAVVMQMELRRWKRSIAAESAAAHLPPPTAAPAPMAQPADALPI